MFESVAIATEQTFMLFVLMGVGLLSRQFGVMDQESVKRLTAIVVNLTTPCIIVTAFQCPFEVSRLPALGWSAAMAATWYGAGIVYERLVFRGDRSPDGRALRWSTVFSNCGYMGLPLAYALFGTEGVFYGAVPIAFFNLIGWTYGVAIFRPLQGRADLVRGLLNPANVAMYVALILFFLPWRLPHIVAEPMRMIGEMNTPLPMLIMGYYLGGAKFAQAFRCHRTYLMLTLRHFVIPLTLVAVLAFCPFIPPLLRQMAVVPAAAPIGVMLTVFTVQYGGDAEFGTALVATSTLLSIVTIPIVIAASRLFF